MAVYQDKQRKTWFYSGKTKDISGEIKPYKKRGFTTKREAKEAESIFLLSTQENGCNITLNELYEEYIHFCDGRKKNTTITKDKQSYRLYIKDAFGNKNIKQISVKDIVRFQHDLSERGINSKYINHIFKIFNKFYSYANKMYNLNYNPIKLVGRLKEERREYVTWDYEEFKRFINCVNSLKYKTAFQVLYMSGMRRGELQALQWIDFNKSTLKISKTCAHMVGGYEITPPKTENSYRTIELDTNTIALLDKLYEDMKSYDGFTKKWFIFGDINPISFNALGREKEKYEKISMVKHIRIHDMRHSHISLLINHNMPLPAIASRVGDTIDTVLKTYSHLFEKSNTEVMNFLNNI